MELPSDPALSRLRLHLRRPGTPTADALQLLASWAADNMIDNADESESETSH